MAHLQDIILALQDFDNRIASLQHQILSTNPSPIDNTHTTRLPPTYDAPTYPPSITTPSLFPKPNQPANTSLESLLGNINNVLPHALAKSTSTGYAATVRRFLEFCDTHTVPPHMRFPTDEIVLSSFAASFATRASGSSASSAIAALKTWHAVHNAPWNAGPRLSYILKAVSNLAPPTARKPIRPGITIKHLDALHTGLNIAAPKDAAIFAAASVAFWGICRLGEILGSSRRYHDPSRFPSRNSLSSFPTRSNPLYLSLPRTKTSQTTGATIRILEQYGPTDPFYAIANHLSINNTANPTDHLFAFRPFPDSPMKCLIKDEFLKRCNQIWANSNLGHLSGHNFRIGGANTFIDNGVPTDIVKAMGRWKSGAYYKYWRKTEDKSAAHAQFISQFPRRIDPRSASQGRPAPPALAT